MVAFGILPQNSGRLWGPTNDTFAYDCSLSDGYNQRLGTLKLYLLCFKKKYFLYSQVVGMQKSLGTGTYAIAHTHSLAQTLMPLCSKVAGILNQNTKLKIGYWKFH